MANSDFEGLAEIGVSLQLYADVVDKADPESVRVAASLVAASFAQYLADLRIRGSAAPLIDALSAVMRTERIVGDPVAKVNRPTITVTASYTVRVKSDAAVYHLALRRIRQHGLEEFDTLRAYQDPMSSVAALYEVDGWQPDSYGIDAIEVLDASWSIGKARKG